MEQTGWNYKNWVNNGRNIYVFRDTIHSSQEIQDIIYNEATDKINSSQFDVLFIEGSEGKIKALNGSRSVCKKAMLNKKSPEYERVFKYMSGAAAKLYLDMMNRINNNTFSIYGVDSYELIREQIKELNKLAQMDFGLETIDPSDLIDDINDNMDYIVEERSAYAVDSINKYMKELGINSAGLIFGNGHINDITEGFKKNGIGYASFYPGRSIPSADEFMLYILAHMNAISK